MERLHALWMLYQVEEYSRNHGPNHKVINDWAHKEILDHAKALTAGEHTQPEPEVVEEPEDE